MATTLDPLPPGPELQELVTAVPAPRAPFPAKRTDRDVLMLNWRDLTNPEGGGSELYVESVASESIILSR